MGTRLSNQSVQTEVSMRVARKTLDAQQQQGEAVNGMLRAAAEMAKELGAREPAGRLDVMG